MKPERRSALAAALVAVLLLALSYPTLRWLVNEWLTNDYYSHGWLVLPVSAYLAWRQWPKGDTTPANLGLIPLGVGLVAYLVALLSKAYFVAALALIVLLVGLVWLFLGTRALRRLAFPLGFLVFMVPLPFVERASLPLQLLTGVCSTAVARVVGVDATVKGAQVTLPNVDLVVGAQCSGLRSIVALFTLVAILVYVLDGPWWGRLLLVISAVPVAILGNIVRVASLLWVADTWGAGAGMTYYHDYSGAVFFLFAFALLILLSRALRCREIRDDIF
ncbi:MAG TPA: exosortase/archaeosortase family protein [Anaerolineae bacterium]|nr:exosortase/archaeosortase family protein [Anaerolineae bacterium]